MTIKNFIETTVERVAGHYSLQEARIMAIRLLQHYCGYNNYEYIVEPNRVLESDKSEQLEKAVLQLVKLRPLQYVIGWQEFCGLKIEVEEGVLIPRPETEELLLWAEKFLEERAFNKDNASAERSEPLRILDAACGSGAIAVALAKKFPNAEVFACDISKKALEVSEKNLKANGCNNAKLIECNLLDNNVHENILKHIKNFGVESSAFDLIISNPPYVTESERLLMHSNVLKYEPAEALFVPDGNPLLYYRALEKLAKELLVYKGAIFMECNEQFAFETFKIFNNPFFTDNEVRKDINDRFRMVKAVKA